MTQVEYLEKRAKLIAHDRSLRKDHITPVTDTEASADKIIRSIRSEEAISVWGKDDHDSIPHPFPGMEFLTGRELIVKTKLFKILSKMPKGALLHSHLDATVNPRILLDIALKQPAMHVRTTASLQESHLVDTAKSTVLPQFRALPIEQYRQADSLTHQNYVPNTWVPILLARDNFDPSLGGPKGFDQWVINSLMISPNEAYKTHNTVTKIWQKFSSTFGVSDGLFRHTPVLKEYIREFFASSVEDKISYTEVRIPFFEKFYVGPDGKENVTHEELLVIFETALKDFKKELAAQGRENDFHGARIIYTTLRFVSAEELEWYTEDCIALKQKFPHLIVGFDLVGPENDWKPLIDYIEPLTRFQNRQKELNIEIPFFFHAGETLGDGDFADDNLYDAILLGTKRIGHGFSLVKHPELMKICRDKGIAIEVCPISNEILRLTSSMPMHPLPILFNYGIPVALSSDDPAVFGNLGLTFDFYQVLVSSEVTGLSQLQEIARDSILHSTLEGEARAQVILCWEAAWKSFIEELIATKGNY